MKLHSFHISLWFFLYFHGISSYRKNFKHNTSQAHNWSRGIGLLSWEHLLNTRTGFFFIFVHMRKFSCEMFSTKLMGQTKAKCCFVSRPLVLLMGPIYVPRRIGNDSARPTSRAQFSLKRTHGERSKYLQRGAKYYIDKLDGQDRTI